MSKFVNRPIVRSFVSTLLDEGLRFETRDVPYHFDVNVYFDKSDDYIILVDWFNGPTVEIMRGHIDELFDNYHFYYKGKIMFQRKYTSWVIESCEEQFPEKSCCEITQYLDDVNLLTVESNDIGEKS